MAGDNRGPSSLFRRAEQLRRWQESETNREDICEKDKRRKVNFSDGCIFLAAGSAGDKDELKRLLDRGADINTVNQDGITALHAACIDNNLEIVEFLVDNYADINRCDMEGWTPLHATASCGSLSMAEFLIKRGADLSVVNNDGELAIDVVDEDDMAKLLQEEMDRRGIDCAASRSREERHMLDDVHCWIASKKIMDQPHPKTGATALHVAAAKGYIKVMRLLLEARIDINAKDFDGWTPLHAAAHWGQTEACEILCDNMADMEILNSVGQTAYDLADESKKPLMDELKRKQASNKLKTTPSKKRKPSPNKDRSNKKEKDSLREDSDEKRTILTGVNHAEIQSWRRGSLRTKMSSDLKNSKEEGRKTSENVAPTPINDHENDLLPHKTTKTSKEERNSQDLSRLQDLSIVKSDHNTNTTPAKSMVWSFVPPSRDDESETQRRAHAKMVRSTRRSTQGITLEDVKSAEQLMIRKTSAAESSSSASKQSNSTAEAHLLCANTASNQDSSFPLETSHTKDKSRLEGENDTVVHITIPSRKKSTTEEKKDEKSDTRASNTREGTQAAIHRKKKPKRRSTGVVTVDIGDIDPDKKNSKEEMRRTEERDPLGSTNANSASGIQNGEIDYKKLYEEQLVENDKLMERLRVEERELRQSKETIDSQTRASNSRIMIAETDKREKRAIERKLSEMEEELRELDLMRQENQRLKDENGALIRVISKLSR